MLNRNKKPLRSKDEYQAQQALHCFLNHLKAYEPDISLRGTSYEEIDKYISLGYEFATVDMIENGRALVKGVSECPGMETPKGTLLLNDLIIMYTHKKIRDKVSKQLNQVKREEDLFTELEET